MWRLIAVRADSAPAWLALFIALRVHSDDTWLALFAQVDEALLWRVQTHRPSGRANLHEECGAICRYCERASL